MHPLAGQSMDERLMRLIGRVSSIPVAKRDKGGMSSKHSSCSLTARARRSKMQKRKTHAFPLRLSLC